MTRGLVLSELSLNSEQLQSFSRCAKVLPFRSSPLAASVSGRCPWAEDLTGIEADPEALMMMRLCFWAGMWGSSLDHLGLLIRIIELFLLLALTPQGPGLVQGLKWQSRSWRGSKMMS